MDMLKRHRIMAEYFRQNGKPHRAADHVQRLRRLMPKPKGLAWDIAEPQRAVV